MTAASTVVVVINLVLQWVPWTWTVIRLLLPTGTMGMDLGNLLEICWNTSYDLSSHFRDVGRSW